MNEVVRQLEEMTDDGRLIWHQGVFDVYTDLDSVHLLIDDQGILHGSTSRRVPWDGSILAEASSVVDLWAKAKKQINLLRQQREADDRREVEAAIAEVYYPPAPRRSWWKSLLIGVTSW